MLFLADTSIRWGVCYTFIRIARPPVCGFTAIVFYWKKVRFCYDEPETTKIMIYILISRYLFYLTKYLYFFHSHDL